MFSPPCKPEIAAEVILGYKKCGKAILFCIKNVDTFLSGKPACRCG